MRREVKHFMRDLLVEAGLYAGLVAAYFLLVLHLLGDWLAWLYAHERRTYAGVALGLIIGQGLLLELLTRLLLAVAKLRGRAR